MINKLINFYEKKKKTKHFWDEKYVNQITELSLNQNNVVIYEILIAK